MLSYNSFVKVLCKLILDSTHPNVVTQLKCIPSHRRQLIQFSQALLQVTGTIMAEMIAAFSTRVWKLMPDKLQCLHASLIFMLHGQQGYKSHCSCGPSTVFFCRLSIFPGCTTRSRPNCLNPDCSVLINSLAFC